MGCPRLGPRALPAGIPPGSARQPLASRRRTCPLFLQVPDRLFQDPAPLLAGLSLIGRVRADGRRKLVLPLIRPAGIDEQPGVETLLCRVDRRIERAAPRSLDDVE